MPKQFFRIFIFVLAAFGIATLVYVLSKKSSLPAPAPEPQALEQPSAAAPPREQRVEVREVKGVSFCRATASTDVKPLDCWKHLTDGDIDGEDGAVIMRNGGVPYVVLTLSDAPRPLSKLRILTDTNTGKPASWLKDFHIEASLDGKAYTPLLKAVKSQTAGWEDFSFPSQASARIVKILFISNYGDKAWTQVGEVEIHGQ